MPEVHFSPKQLYRSAPEVRERTRESNRKYQKTPKGRERAQAAWKKWLANNRPKRRAQKRLQLAVKRGLVLKPVRCTKCGKKPPRERLHGHHHNGYEREHRLDVAWLCHWCHHPPTATCTESAERASTGSPELLKK